MDIFTKGPLYPTLTAKHIENPSRFYAVPVLGLLIKIIMLIPVGIELGILGFAFLIVQFINSFYVLFTGTYWDTAYQLTLGIMRLSTKLYFFLSGLTNKYPGFDFTIHDGFSVEMKKPEHPNRLFAIPLFGGLARCVLLIPFFLWLNLIQYAAQIGIFVSFVPVLFNGRYPESTFEMAQDHMRLNLTGTAYFSGLSDTYPNFSISFTHREIKIVLLVLGALWMLSSWKNNVDTVRNPQYNNYRYNKQMYPNPTAMPFNNGNQMYTYPSPTTY